MPSTPNKGYEVQTTGTNSGTWGNVLNDNMISYADLNIGGIVTKSLASTPVALSASESRNAILRLTGTLLANVQVTTSCIGFFFVENLTSGAFTVTVRNSSVVTAATIPQGTRATVISDATNGCRVASDSGFEPGTTMTFVQTTAPVGWTKGATHNNKALRVVTGAASSGGSVAFTTAFASQAITGTVGNTTLTESQIPSHRHFVAANANVINSPALTPTNYVARDNQTGGGDDTVLGGTAVDATIGLTSAKGGDQSHTHSFTGNNVNLAVQYVDLIIAVKD